MKLFTIPGVLGISFSIVGLAFLADGVSGFGNSPDAPNHVDQAVGDTLESVGAVASEFLITSAHAQDMQQDDLADLLRVEDHGLEVEFDGSVSTEVLGSRTIRKFEFGRLSVVNVVQTSTGTYSSDGLASPNVSYAGVTVNRAAPAQGAVALIWDAEMGWMPLPSPTGASMTIQDVTLSGVDGQRNWSRVCEEDGTYSFCS